MCKRGKGNVRDRFRNLQQQEQTIENQDNMSLMGRETLHIQKQIMIIATMTMMEQISRSTSTCTTEAGVGCSRSAESIGRVLLLLLAKSSTSIAKSWRRNKQVEKLVEVEFRSVMHAIIIAIHHRQNRRKKHPPARPPPSRGEGTSRQRAPIISRLKAFPRMYITQVPISKREKERKKNKKRKKEINTTERK